MSRSITLRVLLGAMVVVASAFAGNTGPSPVPEPATMVMMGGGVGAVLLLRRFRSKKK